MASIQSLFPKALNFGETKDPIRSLWRNVLIVALEDAVGRHWRNKSYGSPRIIYLHNPQESTLPNQTEILL